MWTRSVIGLYFLQAEDGIRDYKVTGVQTCALPISRAPEGHALHDLALRLRRSDALGRAPLDEHPVPALSADAAWVHAGDEDVVRRALVGQRLGEVEEGGVGSAADHVVLHRLHASDTDDVDDAAAPASHQVREHLAGHADVAEELELPAVEPGLVGERQERAALRGAGI